MEKNMEAVRKPVELPEGHMCKDCCAECELVRRNDRTSEGKIYCGKFSKYVWGSDSACSYFIPINAR